MMLSSTNKANKAKNIFQKPYIKIAIVVISIGFINECSSDLDDIHDVQFSNDLWPESIAPTQESCREYYGEKKGEEEICTRY
ncbi:hypothetical protein [Psychrobacter sp. I-STPA10]|uniref:hypothetical protein n=1 Tax=Psychrobacter sp. I-STPA10 TaxID=2585769 RepID=UPI001E3E25D4|nr:hypothetical protein [Psychrobacter sp. I-STPA10]